MRAGPSVVELLRSAHQEIWDLTAVRDQHPTSVQLLAGWGYLAAASRHVLVHLPVGAQTRHDQAGLVGVLERGAGLAQATPDTRLEQAARSIAAAGDLLAGEPAPAAPEDRLQVWSARRAVLRLIEAAAASALGYLNDGGSHEQRRLWGPLAQAQDLAGRLLVPPPARDSRSDDPVATGASEMLDIGECLRSWLASAAAELARGEAGAIPAIAHDAGAFAALAGHALNGHPLNGHPLTASDDVGTALVHRAHRWNAAAQAWPPHVTPGRRPQTTYRHDTARLRGVLTVASAPGDRTLAALRQVATQLPGLFDELAESYIAQVLLAVERGQLLVAASRLDRPQGGYTVAQRRAREAGRWVPLPADDPKALALNVTAFRLRSTEQELEDDRGPDHGLARQPGYGVLVVGDGVGASGGQKTHAAPVVPAPVDVRPATSTRTVPAGA